MSSETSCVDCGMPVYTIRGALCGACYLRRAIDGRPSPSAPPPRGWVRCRRCGVFFPAVADGLCRPCRLVSPPPSPPAPPVSPSPALGPLLPLKPPPTLRQNLYRIALWCGLGGLPVGATAGVVAALNGWQRFIPGVTEFGGWLTGEVGSAVVGYSLLVAALLAAGAVTLAVSRDIPRGSSDAGGCGCWVMLLLLIFGGGFAPKLVAGSSHLFASGLLCAAGFAVQCVLVGPFAYVLWRSVFPPRDPDELPDEE